MGRNDDRLVRVQSKWNEWRNATIRLADIDDVHWFQPTQAPRALLHGYVSCAHLAAGDLPHMCEESSSPHRLRICILKRHTLPEVYRDLVRRADERRAPMPESCARRGMYDGRAPAAGRRL